MIHSGHVPTFLVPLALGFGVLGCSPESKNQEKKPNVLLILADDLGYHDLSITGSTFYETPNIDRIAQEGMTFSQGYAASRVCSPSRASIMTGKFTARHGITDWIGAKSGSDWRDHERYDKLLPASYRHALPEADSSLAEVLKRAGYTTFFAGKWHLGGVGSAPEDHGFAINRGGWDKGSPIGGYFSPWENPKLDNRRVGENLTLRLARETVDFITSHRDSSFFAMLSFYAVHGPIQTTEEKWRKYRDKAVAKGIADSGYVMERNLPLRIVQDNPIYGGLVETMDDAVGMVLKALDSLGLEGNTIVIFTSDNGGVASGDAFSTSNLPLRGGKGYQWEGGIREPYFIKVPWLSNAGSQTDVPAVGTDLFPTILDLAGLPLMPNQHRDGVSLKPVLEGGVLEERPLYWHYPHYGNQGGDPSSMVRMGPWKLIYHWEDGRSALYNLTEDPGEKKDVAEAYPDITRKLGEQLRNWLREVGANEPMKDPEYDANMDAKRLEQIKNDLLPELEARRKEFLEDDFRPNTDWWGSQTMDGS